MGDIIVIATVALFVGLFSLFTVPVDVSKEEMEYSLAKCVNNSGLKQLTSNNAGRKSVRCNDGAIFFLTSEEIKNP